MALIKSTSGSQPISTSYSMVSDNREAFSYLIFQLGVAFPVQILEPCIVKIIVFVMLLRAT